MQFLRWRDVVEVNQCSQTWNLAFLQSRLGGNGYSTTAYERRLLGYVGLRHLFVHSANAAGAITRGADE